MADLARIAGVSKITVSRALGDSATVNADTRKRVRALAVEHGYRLNVTARNLRLRRSHTIAVIVEMNPSVSRPMSDPYPLELLGGIAQELSTTDYSIVLTVRHGTPAPAVQAADAVVLLGQGAHQDAVRSYDRLHRPMVVWGAPTRGDAHVVVGSDNRQGGASAAERFLSLGRRHPVFLGNTDHAENNERHAGFEAVFAAHRVKSIVLHVPEFTAAAGLDAIKALRRRKASFDAVFACNDLLAMGAVRALVELGVRVPDDVSVIGYDDSPVGAAFIPPLTSVHQNWTEGGILLARKALALIRGESVRSELLPTRIVVRGT